MNDDSNPMSGLGYGRGDDTAAALNRTQPIRRQTMAYSIVDEEEAKRRHGGTASAKLSAIPLPKTTTVQDIVTQITEREINAWLAIPVIIRGMMLANPEQFTLIANETYPNDIPYFSMNGMVFKWNGDNQWYLSDYRK